MGKSQENIRDIIMQAVEAGRISAERTAKDAFKATERRLYGLPTLKIKLEDDLERLEEFKLYGPRERSKSITRFIKNGNRLSPDEIWEAVLMDMEATIAADRYEIETLERALATVRDDPYYRALSGKYLDDVDDRDIAEDLAASKEACAARRSLAIRRGSLEIRACNFAVQFYNLTVQFICVILIHNERVWVEKTVINTKFRASFL